MIEGRSTLAAKKKKTKKKKPKSQTTDVATWYDTHTYFTDYARRISELVDLKRGQQLKITLVLPTLNEGKTIGRVVATFKKRLVDQFPLLDEILVVDSGSVDNTKIRAQQAGAKFCLAEKHLKDEGIFFGKGENLWTSLFVGEGDIFVWIDADITNIHPRFVYNLLGPLLENDEIGYIKGFYQRPLVLSGETGIQVSVPEGGGRVTEILFKPIINRLFPELAAIIQPLSGEYAARREIVENVPFFTGYGVETGLLIDIMHHNQSLRALGKMSHGIAHVLFQRAQEMGRMDLADFLQEIDSHFTIIRDGEDYSLTSHPIAENEKRPIIEIGEYRRRHKR